MDSIDNICVNFQDILDSYERIKVLTNYISFFNHLFIFQKGCYS